MYASTCVEFAFPDLQNFEDVHSYADFWSWLRLGFLPAVFQPVPGMHACGGFPGFPNPLFLVNCFFVWPRVSPSFETRLDVSHSSLADSTLWNIEVERCSVKNSCMHLRLAVACANDPRLPDEAWTYSERRPQDVASVFDLNAVREAWTFQSGMCSDPLPCAWLVKLVSSGFGDCKIASHRYCFGSWHLRNQMQPGSSMLWEVPRMRAGQVQCRRQIYKSHCFSIRQVAASQCPLPRSTFTSTASLVPCLRFQ